MLGAARRATQGLTLVKEMYSHLVKNGYGNQDLSSLYKKIERLNKK